MHTVAIGYWPNYFHKAAYSAGSFSRPKKVNLILAGTIICFLIVIVSAAYFLEINSVSSLGYEMKSYQQSIERLKAENQEIKLDMAESASFKKIEDPSQMEKLNLVGISDYQYLTIPSSSFAKR